MARYVAFLRAINVGRRVVRGAELTRIFEGCGCSEVATFLASGNVLFTSRRVNTAALERTIERALERALGYASETFIRTPDELAAVAAFRPCSPEPAAAGGAMYVLFTREPFDPPAARRLAVLSTPEDAFVVRDREVFWCRYGRLSESRVKDAQLARALGRPATTRTMNTIVRLLGVLDAPARAVASRAVRARGE